MAGTAFEAREARGQVKFEGRLREMNIQRRGGNFFRYLHSKVIDTALRRRTSRRRSTYLPTHKNKSAKMIKKTVKEAKDTQWFNRIQEEPAVEMYGKLRGIVRREIISII